ncbi:MAG: XRE family transcriptional regulator [Isosphaeraceae bacterium]
MPQVIPECCDKPSKLVGHGCGYAREVQTLGEEVRAEDEVEVARTIYRLRSGAKLTQQALAERVGTTASVISRLEDADYTGHSLAMLRRIAAALGRRVEIRFPAVKTAKPASPKGKSSVRSGEGRSRSKLGTSSL